MKRIIFYSWQSDLEPSVNRNLIEDALKRALRSIKKGATATVEPVLDRDTSGIAGSPSISDAIFAKIALADMFVADLSIINPRTTKRRTPNPNVLVELGLAVAKLGWNRILLIQNTAFGGPDNLPFDLRGRRIIPYELAPGAPDRAEARALLQGRLESGLRAALNDSADSTIYAGLTVPLWWGKWHIADHGEARGGDMFIREVGTAGFLFEISVFNGGHIGELSGFARLIGPDLAYARIKCGVSEGICELSFHRSMPDGRREIEIGESRECYYFRGMGASFACTYVRKRDSLFDGGILDEIDLARLYRITGPFYDPLTRCLQGLSDKENIDRFPAKATVGGVRGLYTIMEGIVMRGNIGQLWAAYIDGHVVRYFTTEYEYQQQLPKTIEHWRERFKEKKVILDSHVDRIEKNNL